MTIRFDYLDPRGRRSGPFAEQELRRLASTGMLEPDGIVIPLWDNENPLGGLEDTVGGDVRSRSGATGSVAWKVREVEWLMEQFPRGSATPPPVPEPTSPMSVPVPSMNPLGSQSGGPGASDCSRATFILLALLPALVGVFGVGHVRIGRIAVGVLQLVLSIFTISGCIFGGLSLPCACVGIPLYLALFAWTLVDVVLTERDAQGRWLR